MGSKEGLVDEVDVRTILDLGRSSTVPTANRAHDLLDGNSTFGPLRL
jgi:hypothetical protein